ncbi:hypothetical protein P43SY_000667 [Pythium insidiosum]|uniref:Uncharacterized protein n=1 Tax=Pythium insidiosum TaxID=114742 RepID=A0AAD5LNH7_PYTIN|nr:hypothetical protein P43SY_000667 [Pythium insidiosum]KAJ0408216.1 hypothetical protein ATCC90586_003324 [Pythium insidiosum]
MFARQTARALRNTQTRSISGLVEKPSTVTESQKLFLTSHKPTYLKRDSDKVLFFGLLGGLAFGAVQWIRGEINMSTGTGKKE